MVRPILPGHTHSIGVLAVAIHGHDPPMLLQCWAAVQSAESSLKSTATAAALRWPASLPASWSLQPCNLSDLDGGSGKMMMIMMG